MQVTMYY